MGGWFSVGMLKANALYIPLKDKSVQSMITSPPYWGLRKYEVPDMVWDGDDRCEHEWGIKLIARKDQRDKGFNERWGNSPGQKKQENSKGGSIQQGQFCSKCNAWRGQLGLEPMPELYISHLMQIMAECHRVLRDDGIAFINLGDTYYGGGQGPQTKYGKQKHAFEYGQVARGSNKLKPKTLCLIPERFVIACQEQGWIIRNSVIWYKRNAMPSSVKDRFSVTHEKIFMVVKQKKYFFNLEEVLEPYTKPLDRWGGETLKANGKSNWDEGTGQTSYRNRKMRPNPKGRNPRDVWDITTQGYSGAHFATFPEKLAERMILCSTRYGDVVCDPFAGSGTVAKVAIKYNRKAVGLDLGYHNLQKERIKEAQMKGFFDTVPKKKPKKVKDNCEECGLYKTVNSPKMGITGKGRKKILFWAEVAGATEDSQNVQLVGEAGQTLRDRLRKFRFRLDIDGWKINSVMCRSTNSKGNNRTPTTREINLCRPKVIEAVKKLKPEKIVLLGATAVESFLGDRMNNIGGVSKWAGWSIPDQDFKCWVFPTYHPQYLNYNSKNGALDLMFSQHLENAIKWDKPFYDYSHLHEKVQIATTTNEAVNILKSILEIKPRIVIDFECTGLKPHAPGHEILCISIAYYHPKEGLVSKVFPNFDNSQFQKYLKKVFTSNEIKKVAQNLKYENNWARTILGYEIYPWVWDTMLATHCLDNRNKITSLDFQTYVKYGVLNIHTYTMNKLMESKSKSANSFNKLKEMDQTQLMRCCGLHSLFEHMLMEDQQREMGWEATGYQLLHNGILAFSDIENNGICVDTEYYKNEKVKLERQTRRLEYKLKISDEAELYKSKTGKDINFNSTKQLQELLFGYMNIKPIRETKTGYSTDEKVLRQLENKVPIVDCILQKKKIKKIGDKINEITRETINEIMRPTINLHIPRTFRSSINSPNFQNIFKRNEYAKKILRSGIKPSKGNFIFSKDFKGIEVAIGCLYHKDPVMIDYVKDKTKDMHRDLAMQLFILELVQMTGDIRYSGKNEFIFPEFYGDWYESCAQALWKSANVKKTSDGVLLTDHLYNKGIKRYIQFEKHVKNVEYDFWFKRFKVYTEWKDEIWEQYQKDGYITLLTGFKCCDLMDRKQVINSPIQGTAFHILLWCLIEMNKIIKKEKLKSKIIGQIHDDGIHDIYPPEFEFIQNEYDILIKKKIYEFWPWINVPLEVEDKVSEIDGNWYEMGEI